MSTAPEGTCTVSQNVPSGLTVSMGMSRPRARIIGFEKLSTMKTASMMKAWRWERMPGILELEPASSNPWRGRKQARKLAKRTVGELLSGVTGFATIYATGSHRLRVQAYAENLPHQNIYSNLANKRGRIYKFSISMNLLVTGISDS